MTDIRPDHWICGFTHAEGALLVWVLTEYADHPNTTQPNREDVLKLATYIANATHQHTHP